MLPAQLQNLINHFTKLPGIGPRQATRFVFYLLRNIGEISALSDTLKAVGEGIRLCENCFLPAQNSNVPGTVTGKSRCSVCANHKRDKNIICIVEKETDALNLEKIGQFRGRYFVLGGFIDPLNKENVARERLNFLIRSLENSSPHYEDGAFASTELILALTPRREGDFTSLYIEEQLKPLKEQGAKIKTTRLGRGLSSGAELEYADEETLKNALAGRR